MAGAGPRPLHAVLSSLEESCQLIASSYKFSYLRLEACGLQLTAGPLPGLAPYLLVRALRARGGFEGKGQKKDLGLGLRRTICFP